MEERGFEEGGQMGGAKFGDGQGGCPISPSPPTLYLLLVE